MFACGDVEIGHVVISEAMANIEESGLKNAIELAQEENSDLVAGKYEGKYATFSLLDLCHESNHTINVDYNYVLKCKQIKSNLFKLV